MSAQWGQPEPQWQPAVEYAGWWSRVLASILDSLVAFGFIFVAALPLAIVGYAALDEETLKRVSDYVSIPLVLAFLLLYYPLTMRRPDARNGQTWGKQACGIRVVREDGRPVDAQTAILREAAIKYLVFSVAALCALFVPTLVNYLWPLWDPRHQALHDKMVKTYVVRNAPQPTYASGWVPPVPPSASGPVQWGS